MSGREKALKAATTLFIQRGYDGTTMDDIAKAAGLARSTLYTYWRSSEALFTELLWHESVQYLDDWLRRVEADPAGGTFSNIYKHAMYAIQDSPFTRALYTHEQHVFGSYLLQDQMSTILLERFKATHLLMKMLHDAGVIETDVDTKTLAYISAVFRYGLLVSNERIPQQAAPDTDIVLTTFLRMLASLFNPGSADAASEQGKTVLRDYVTRIKQHSPLTQLSSSEK